MMLRKRYKLPVFFHNLRGYESHLILLGLRSFPGLDISLIGQGMEKYLTLGWGEHLVLEDSLHFLASSLEILASNLLRSGTNLQAAWGMLYVNASASHISSCCRAKEYAPTTTSTNWS